MFRFSSGVVGEDWEEQFPWYLYAVFHEDYMWSFYKLPLILSDLYLIICIDCSSEHWLQSVTYI